MYACLAVTCHLHFWQNDRDFLRATVVTRGWNGYRNKSQHRKSTLEKKILPPFQQGFEPAAFQSRVRCSNHWAIPAPSSHKSSITHFYHSISVHSMRVLHAPKQWYGCQCLGFLTCMPMLMHAIATRGLYGRRKTKTKRVCAESWLGEKSLAAPGTRTHISIVPCFSVGCPELSKVLFPFELELLIAQTCGYAL